MSENSIPEGFKMTDFGHLPNVWKVERFGDKGQFQYGYTTSATDKNTGTKFLRITDIKEDGIVNWGTVPYGSIDDNNLQKFRLSKGDILFARIGATTGKTCIIGGVIPNAVFASYLIRFVPDKELHPKYVFYFTQTREYQELVNAGKEGKLKKGLSATELKNFNIPLPPLPEQQKIAEVLSTVQHAKEKTDAVISATKELKKSLMRHLFSYGPVPVNEFDEFNEFDELGVNELQNAQNAQNSNNSSKLKETEIGLVPEEWDVVRLGDVAKLVMGQSPPGTTYNEIGDGVPFLQGKAEFSALYPQHVKYTTKPLKMAQKGTVLISVRAPVGDVNVAQLDYCIGRGLASISLYDGDNTFLFHMLTHLKHDLEKEGTGSTFKAINKTKLMDFKIPFPSLPLQQKIASILSTADKKIEAEGTKKKSLDEVFKSLLQNLMTGKLRVNEL